MDRILRIDERLAAFAKPSMESFDKVFLAPSDVLVVCAGFEERAVGVLRQAVRTGTGFKVLIIDYLPAYPDNRINELIGLCEDSKLEWDRVTYDRQNPAGFGEILVRRLPSPPHRVFLDISGMSRLLIVQAIVAMRSSRRGFNQCFIAYAEAKNYPPEQKTVEKAIAECDKDPLFAALFLSSGVFDVTIVPELSAASLGATQSRLVVFPSFNTDQLTALRLELQPSRYAYIHGIPPSRENQWRTEAIRRLNHLASCAPDSGERSKEEIVGDYGDAACKREEHFKTCTLAYQDTLDCLCKIYNKHGIRDRLLISPTGSKMQVIAVALFRAFVEDVQIVYPTPRIFTEPKNYTTGVGAIHILPLAIFDTIRLQP
jgi:hypothetical protein